MQVQVDGLGILEGVILGLDGVEQERPCEECGGMVDLSAKITVRVYNVETQTEAPREMTESDARTLLAYAQIPPPPVLCDQHEDWMGSWESHST